MPDRPRYLAASLGLDLSDAALAAQAAWLDLEPLYTRPLPTDRTGLVLTAQGPHLRVPGGGEGLWPAGLVDWRIERGTGDALVEALAPRAGEWVLDCTFGLGHDALVLARRGARVLALERRPALLFYSAAGVARHDPQAARRIAVRCADHREVLAALPDGAFPAVYLDPMFPPNRHRRGATLEALRRCALLDPLDPATLREAWRVASRVVVLRLPADAEAPTVLGLPPAQIVASRRVRFAAWHPAAHPPCDTTLLAVDQSDC